jgi:hypothetical protein
MKKPQLTLCDIVNEVFSEGYSERAQERARARRSPWHLILIPLFFGIAAAITYVLFQIMWRIHVAIYPEHVDRLTEFWGKGISFSAFVSSFLLVVPLFLAALPISMMIANAVIWLIPPARRALNKKAEGVKWASFAEAMRGLWIVSGVVVPSCLLLSFIGAATLASLR